ncbi:MAG: translation elongation factor Ts [Nitrospirae bacterium]|nr:translation elongation factor Ts [Nitrospirota bacterium]
MATITAGMVKELRERTGTGMMECKSALAETNGDMEQAIDLLRKKGMAKAAKKAGRETSEGGIGTYVHAGGKIGVMIEVSCETDFVAKTDEFQALLRDIAMHIAGANPVPQVVSRGDLGEDVIAREREVYAVQAAESGKPANIVEKMVEGRINKFVAEVSLLEQPFVKDPEITVGELMTRQVAKLGENMAIRRFVRYQLGEGA